VPETEVPDVWEAVVSVFRDYGYRRLRARARLKFLVADWGVQRFRQVVEDEYLGRKLLDGPAPQAPDTPSDHVGVHRQRDGRFYVGVAPAVGRVSGSLLGKVADVIEAHGSGRVRTTAQQKLLVLDVGADQVEPLITALDRLGLQARPSSWRRNTMACTGLEFCKLAIVDTKDRATWLVGELERRVPELDVPITVNVNGCPNSCARTQVADVGLKGMIVLHEGRQVEGFQVHLGGALGLQAGFGRKLRAHKVPADQLADYVERVTRHFLAERVTGESFAAWVQRADDEVLR
jgi:sulfite reductase (ferredoxin)